MFSISAPGPGACRKALQGFPAGWTFTGTKSSQHRQIGNAVPPPLAEALGRTLFRFLQEMKP